MRLVSLLLFVAFLAFPASEAQTAPVQPPPLPEKRTVLRTTSRLVVVDVVALDKDGNSVTNLSREDFKLREGGADQPIHTFDEHSTSGRPIESSQVKLPPGVFTNYAPASTGGAVNVLLLDALNTPVMDQRFLHQQIAKFLRTAQPGPPMAVFGLTTRLLMLEGFTTDLSVLRAAGVRRFESASPLLDNDIGLGATADGLTANMVPDWPTGGGAAAVNMAALQQFAAETGTAQIDLRIRYTLDAMNLLARYLANIPGRKNVIWFSGSFPLNVAPDAQSEGFTLVDPFAGVTSAEAEYRETIDMFARSEVSLYPVDARGLDTDPSLQTQNSMSNGVRGPQLMSMHTTFEHSTADEHDTMKRMAEDSGGTAYINGNDLAGAVRSAVQQGSHYYTLTYVPPENGGKTRHIDVSVSKPGTHLIYRKTYYPSVEEAKTKVQTVKVSAKSSTPDPENAPIRRAMIHGVPGPSQIIFKASLLPSADAPSTILTPDSVASGPEFVPAKGPYHRYTVDYALLPSHLTLTPTADGKRELSLEFVSIVFAPDGRQITRLVSTTRAALSADDLGKIARAGLHFHQDISVPDGQNLSVRLGVHDLQSDAIGALEVPVAMVSGIRAAAETSTSGTGVPAAQAKP